MDARFAHSPAETAKVQLVQFGILSPDEIVIPPPAAALPCSVSFLFSLLSGGVGSSNSSGFGLCGWAGSASFRSNSNGGWMNEPPWGHGTGAALALICSVGLGRELVSDRTPDGWMNELVVGF